MLSNPHLTKSEINCIIYLYVLFVNVDLIRSGAWDMIFSEEHYRLHTVT